MMTLWKYLFSLFFVLVLSVCQASICHFSNVSLERVDIPIKQEGTAEQFIRSIYANYEQNGNGVDIFNKRIDIPSPALAKLMNQDTSLLKGEVGALDADPICDCQDWDEVKIIKLQIKLKNTNKTTAHVLFSNCGENNINEFDLIQINNNWYIDDIHSSKTPSLRALLEQEIKELSQPKKF
jgi:hypothetical protein